jgi:hypothetical protein
MKKPLFKVHKKYWSSKSFQKVFFDINVITSYYCWIIYSLKTLYEGAWSPYSLIMYCYRFLSTPLKVHYIMAIQKLSIKFIQCDFESFFILVDYVESHGQLQIPKSCKSCFVTTFYGQCNVLSPIHNCFHLHVHAQYNLSIT